MTSSMNYLRQFLNAFASQGPSVRVFFPDQKELLVATQGKAMDPNAGSWTPKAVFDKASFKLDYLTRPTGLLDIGIDLNKARPARLRTGFIRAMEKPPLPLPQVNVASRAKETDKLFVAAYPHFSPNEILAVEELWRGAARDSGRPVVVFNGELDRLRGGYYPGIFYPKIAKISREWVPRFTTAYYIHNFKSTTAPGTLFRCYPGPWQVLRRYGPDVGVRAAWGLTASDCSRPENWSSCLCRTQGRYGRGTTCHLCGTWP